MENEKSTIEKLDQLADFQAQIDYLEMQKRELLDAVKIPDEVLAAQDEANKRRQKLDADALIIQKEIQGVTAQLMSEVVEPELPDEYKAALAAARQQREDIQSQATSRYEQLQKKMAEQKARVDADLQAKTRDVYAHVETRRAEINAEFSGKTDAAQDNIAKLTAEIKADVTREGKTVKGALYQAVYQKGRVTWNTDMLDGMIVAFPELVKARKEGAPSVALRRIG